MNCEPHSTVLLTELVQRQTAEPVAKHRLELIQSSGTHLLELIGALLDVSRIDAGRLELHPSAFDLANEVRNLADLYELRCQGKGIGFRAMVDIPETCWVHGDAARVRQVLHNLLGNAVKFTERGLVRFKVHQSAGLFTFEDPDRLGLELPLPIYLTSLKRFVKPMQLRYGRPMAQALG